MWRVGGNNILAVSHLFIPQMHGDENGLERLEECGFRTANSDRDKTQFFTSSGDVLAPVFTIWVEQINHGRSVVVERKICTYPLNFMPKIVGKSIALAIWSYTPRLIEGSP